MSPGTGGANTHRAARLNHWGHLARPGLFKGLREGFSAPEMSLDVLIEVRTTLADRCLWITWMHDGSSLRQATLQRFADDLARRLDLWARTCTSH